jgi:3-oxoacyl-[acyl-carrier-protein] synthase-3
MLFVHGLGHFHPGNEISNRFLESLDIGTSDAWIVERVGIRSRRTVLPLDYIRATRNCDLRAALEAAEYGNAELAARAARLALARAGVGVEQIGLVVCGSSAPDSLTPAEACRVARALGIEAPAFDLNSACTSFLVGLHVLAGMRPERLPDFVLCVAVDSLTKVVDYRDRAAAVLWGDGAAAAVLSPRVPGLARVLATHVASAPAGADKVRVLREEHFVQEGRQVQMFAIKKSAEGYAALRDAFEDDARSLHFVGHQANLRVLEATCARCDIAPERHHANVELFGNTGSAGAPSVVSMSWEKWRSGDDVALVGVGAGLTWARALLRFGGEVDVDG